VVGLCVAGVTILATAPAIATVMNFHWTVDGKPPTTVDDLHLHFQIAKTPFEFGKAVIDDKGRFGKADGSTPGPDGAFTVDFGLASPAYGPTDNVHVAFNFASSEDVTLVFAEWTFGSVLVGTAQNLDVTREVSAIDLPATMTCVLAGLMLLLAGSRRRA
jgi:hypothetical protein